MLRRPPASFFLVPALAFAVACSGDDGSSEPEQPRTPLLQSDDFRTGLLDSQTWQVVDPQRDGTVELVGAGTSDAHLRLSVPEGTEHDPWTTNTALRVMQRAEDEDFEVEVRFESEPTEEFQSQGLLVEQDSTNFVRFDVYSTGTALRVFSATIVEGTPETRADDLIPEAASTIYLRLARSGDSWTARYSLDGSNWETTTSFSHAMAVSAVGIFAGNAGPNPAYTAVVDYFFDVAAPLDPEDPPCDPARTFAVETAATGPGRVVREPDKESYTCGDVVVLTAEPESDASFLGWTGTTSVATNPLTLTVGADASFTASFGFEGPNVEVWYGESQSFGALGNPQQWINVLGQVEDSDGVEALSYSLNEGPATSLSLGPFRRLAEPGDFNVEIDYLELVDGLNTIEILAVDALGFQTTKTVALDYSADTVWPLPYEVDWSSVGAITDVAQVVDGRWSVVEGTLRNDRERYDRAVAIGDITWTDYEATVPVTIHGFSAVGFESPNTKPGVGVMLKWPGHSAWTEDQPTFGWYPAGGGGWYELEMDGTGRLALTDLQNAGLSDPLDRVLAIGTTYIWKVRVESEGGTAATYSLKVWEEGSPEPVGWEIVGTDDTDVAGGSLLLLAHFTDVSFGNVVIDPL